MSEPKLLLVEDDPALVELLSWHFKREGFEIAHTPDGEYALLLASENPPDLILLDWMIESISGVEVCRRLRRAPTTASVPIIMLTGRGEEADRVRGLESGADDYVTKPFSPRELIARVRAVLRRVSPSLGSQLLQYADIEMDLVAHKARRAGALLTLSPIEYKLLRHLLQHPERVFSRDRLLSAVWGPDSDVGLRSVDVHIRRLRAAINVNGGAELIRTVRATGYSLDQNDV